MPEELPGLALKALEQGKDSPSLRMLAGLTRNDMDRAKMLFEQSLAELSLEIPDSRVAVHRLARDVARRILNGSIGSHEGSKQIWNLSVILDERFPELDTFVYAASEWEERPEDWAVFVEGVRAAARDLVAQVHEDD